jgi:MFS family permease
VTDVRSTPAGAGSLAGAGVAAPAVAARPVETSVGAEPGPARVRGIALPRTFVALRHRDFAFMMGGTLPAMLAMQMGQIAFGYLAYQISGSATALGLVGLCWGIPMLTLSLVGGVVADWVPRRTIILVTQGAIGLMAVATALLIYTGQLQLWHLYAVALVQGTSFAFNMPARQALSADLVGREDLANAMALFNANMNFSRVIGPAVAGFLIALPALGISGVFALMAFAYVFVLGLFWQIRGGRVKAGTSRASGFQQLKDGLSYIRGNRPLVMLLTLGFLPMMLGMPYQTLMPVFAIGVFDSGAQGLGLLNASAGVGALIGSLALASLGNFAWKRRLQSAMGLAFGLSLMAFALSPTFLLALVVLLVLGGASASYMALNNTLVMEATPREYYGRVMSVYMMTFSLMPLASVPFAALADTVGARPTLATAGALLAAIIALVAFVNRPGGEGAARSAQVGG